MGIKRPQMRAGSLGKRLPQTPCKCWERLPWDKCQPVDSRSPETARRTHAVRLEMGTTESRGKAGPQDRVGQADQVAEVRAEVRGAADQEARVEAEVAVGAARKGRSRESPRYGERSV